MVHVGRHLRWAPSLQPGAMSHAVAASGSASAAQPVARHRHRRNQIALWKRVASGWRAAGSTGIENNVVATAPGLAHVFVSARRAHGGKTQASVAEVRLRAAAHIERDMCHCDRLDVVQSNPDSFQDCMLT